MNRLPPLNSLKAFEAAARHMSVKRAAAELNVTPAAVSHQIRALEDHLGTRLFQRLHRGIELTTDGQSFLEGARAGLDSILLASERLRNQRRVGVLTVAAPAAFAIWWLAVIIIGASTLSGDVPAGHIVRVNSTGGAPASRGSAATWPAW